MRKYLISLALGLGLLLAVTGPGYGFIDGVEWSKGQVNVNTADFFELVQVFGGNIETARNIITYRDANGPFANLDELANVMGVSRARLDTLKKHLKVRGYSNLQIREP